MGRIAGILVAVVVCGLVAGCEEEGHQATSFPTFQLCFDDHTERELLPVPDAIVECCLLHPIAGILKACGADKPACINYLTVNLDQIDASPAEVSSSCETYVARKANPQAEE